MFEAEREHIGTGGGALLAMAWLFALAPMALFFFNFSPKTNYQWIWHLLGAWEWVFPAVALTSAARLTYGEAAIWRKPFGWAAFGLALLVSWSLYTFEGI
jgi:hypothetical protein